MLAFEGEGSAHCKVCEKEYDDEAITLATAAQIVCKDMLQNNTSFTSSFHKECHEQSALETLLPLLSMMHEGPSIKSS